jgi:putative aminopeptidase FrvX
VFEGGVRLTPDVPGAPWRPRQPPTYNGHVVTELDLSLLERLCAAPGVSGREGAVRALVAAELEALVDDISVDSMGNLVGLRRGDGGARVMVAAHMDEVGFLVRSIDDKGWIRVHPVGGIFPQFLASQRVRIHCSGSGESLLGVLSEPSELVPRNTEAKVPKLEEFFVDLGMPAGEVKQRVRIGDAITMERGLQRAGGNIVAKAIDDRVGLFVIIETLRRLPRERTEVIFLASAQEEVGTRGATVAAHRIAKDVAVAVDTTLARDIPGVEDDKACNRLGDGVSIKIMDKGQITHAPLLAFASDLARDRGIPHQFEVGLPGSTDASAIELSGDGSPAIGISIPCRYPHTASETANVGDVAAAIDLLEAFLVEVTPDALKLT